MACSTSISEEHETPNGLSVRRTILLGVVDRLWRKKSLVNERLWSGNLPLSWRNQPKGTRDDPTLHLGYPQR